MFRIDEVATALQRPGAAAHHERRQRAVRVPVAVTDTGSKQQDDVIQQRAIVADRGVLFVNRNKLKYPDRQPK